MPRDSACKLCKNRAKCAKHVCMWGSGPRQAEMLILGGHPEQEDDEQGKHFVGREGRFFRKNIMAPLGIAESETYLDYAVRCVAVKVDKKTKQEKVIDPKRPEILNCRKYLEETMRAVKPKVVVLMGNVALCSFLFLDKVQGVARWRGRPMWSHEFGCWVIATYDMSPLMFDRNMGKWTRFDQTLSDFKKAQEMLSWKAPDQAFPEPKLVKDPSWFQKYLKLAATKDMVAVDLETDGFDPRNEILGVSMCLKHNGAYHPVYVPWNVIQENEPLGRGLDRLLQSDTSKVLHNASFDQKFLHFHGYTMGGVIDDTMVMAHLLDENFSVGLKERTWINLSFGGYDIPLEKYKWEHKFTKKTSYKTIPDEVMAPYAATDALCTLMLAEMYFPMMDTEGVLPLYNKISRPVRQVMTEASINGLPVDVKQATHLSDRMTKAKKTLEERMFDTVGRKFNFGSAKQLGYILYEQMLAPGGKKTKHNAWKVDKSVLGALAVRPGNRRYTRLAQDYLRWKYIDKLQGTYIGQVNEFLWDDGRVHSSYNTTGAVTGRTSNSKPCTHNIPKDRLIRSLYKAPEGFAFVEADIKAAEMRAIALESQDEVLLRIINSGQDIHNLTYCEMFGKPLTYVPTQDERRIAKSINFGLIYGITAVGLARRIDTDVDTAQSYIDRYFKKFVGVARWIEKTVKEAHDTGKVRSMFGRVRRLQEINNDDKYMQYRAERQAMNAPIQGEAADYTYIGMIRISKELKKQKLKSKIVHTVHDCVIVLCPNEEVKAVTDIVTECFRRTVKAFPIAMEVDVATVKRWGEHNESSLEEMLVELAA